MSRRLPETLIRMIVAPQIWQSLPTLQNAECLYDRRRSPISLRLPASSSLTVSPLLSYDLMLMAFVNEPHLVMLSTSRSLGLAFGCTPAWWSISLLR